VKGGYERKSRNRREGREKREVKSADFYLVATLARPASLTASPMMNQFPATRREMLLDTVTVPYDTARQNRGPMVAA
jgi:hypothetical protein